MANKVIVLGKTTKREEDLKPGALKDEVYIDVSMIASPANYPRPMKQDEEDYLALLIEEHGSEEGAYNYIISEESKEFTDDSKEYIRIQYATRMDYGRALRLWMMYGAWKVDKLVNVNAIRNSLHQIFTWIPGERILNPEFGSNLRKLLYEGITQFNVEQIMAEIRHCVSIWEPRVQITRVVNVGTPEDTEDNVVHIDVQYTIPGLTQDQVYSEPIVYKR